MAHLAPRKGGYSGKILSFIKQADKEGLQPGMRITHLLSVTPSFERNTKKFTDDQVNLFVGRLRRAIMEEHEDWPTRGIIWTWCVVADGHKRLDFMTDIQCSLKNMQDYTATIMQNVIRMFADKHSMILGRDYTLEYIVAKVSAPVTLDGSVPFAESADGATASAAPDEE